MEEAPEAKTCTGCGQVKPLDAFNKAQRGKYGRAAKCKECKAAAFKERYVPRPRQKRPIPEVKTCTKCGETKALDQFTKDPRKASGRGAECYECKQARSRARNADPRVRAANREYYQRQVADPEVRERRRAQSREGFRRMKERRPEKIRATGQRNLHRAYGRTLETATRRGFQWTGPELELVMRPDLTAVEVAKMTKRTLYAVKLARYKARKDPKFINLAGISRSARP